MTPAAIAGGFSRSDTDGIVCMKQIAIMCAGFSALLTTSASHFAPSPSDVHLLDRTKTARNGVATLPAVSPPSAKPSYNWSGWLNRSSDHLIPLRNSAFKSFPAVVGSPSDTHSGRCECGAARRTEEHDTDDRPVNMKAVARRAQPQVREFAPGQ